MIHTSANMSMPMLSTVPTSTKKFSKVVGCGRSAARSRSTSAGSSSAQSNGQDSTDSPSPILSTSVTSSPIPALCASPCTDNSFYSTDGLFSTSAKQSPSLEEYFLEHQSTSCTAISPPPGLEDFVKTEDTAAGLVESE